MFSPDSSEKPFFGGFFTFFKIIKATQEALYSLKKTKNHKKSL